MYIFKSYETLAGTSIYHSLDSASTMNVLPSAVTLNVLSGTSIVKDLPGTLINQDLAGTLISFPAITLCSPPVPSEVKLMVFIIEPEMTGEPDASETIMI